MMMFREQGDRTLPLCVGTTNPSLTPKTLSVINSQKAPSLVDVDVDVDVETVWKNNMPP
jgi:hypothetical protein